MLRISRVIFFVTLVLSGFSTTAQTTLPGAMPAPAIGAKAYLLIDVLSGKVLVAQNADEPREPASLTKLMTAYLVFRALRDKELKVRACSSSQKKR
jgi:serine-type D-Ala-D-Ala carboxypeptidase (penicillin-binding protein 5/6)